MSDLFLDPRGKLHGVHPDLVKVMEAAAQHPQPFEIVYGLRSSEAEAEAVASHHSQTLHSRHLSQAHEHDESCAVDVAAIINDELSWAPGKEAEVFGQIAKQVQEAADQLHIPIQWGGAAIGAWVPGVPSHFHDWGHFQLPWKEYP
jgi:peptidoglycan L-alanyl-D-glutamate endopeptidase CwlK